MAKRVDLLKGNITSALVRLAIPLMGMSLIQMAYNLTDMFWIGKLGAGAVASVGTGGILLWFSMGVHTLAQLGGQVLVGQRLGSGDHEKAGQYAHAAIFLSACISILLGTIFFFGNQLTVSIFGLNGATVIQDAREYVMIAGGFILFSLVGKLLTALTTTTGDSRTPFIATTLGLVFNILLDPILIFGYFGFPALGVKGAAIATVFAQFIVFLLLVIHTRKDQHLFKYVHIFKKVNLKYCLEILKLSFPTAVQSTLFPMISMYLSRMVAGFGDDAVAVQRIGSQIESISWMTSEGFAVAVNSFVAQNYGASNIKRAKKGYYTALKILCCFGVVNTILLMCFPELLFSVFLSEASVVAMGKDYLIILGISQLFMCVEILSSSSMNAFSKTVLPATISILFTAIRIPIALVLSATVLGLNGIWWSITISSIFKGIILFIAILYCFRKLSKQHVTSEC